MVYAICETEAEWVRQIFRWFVQERQRIAWIIRELNRLHVAKGHRARTAKWSRQYVIGILRSEKYIGLWPWGLHKNVRIPETGQIVQEERPEEETEKWLREFPALRVIDDQIYDEAQRLLDLQVDATVGHRKDRGRIHGSSGSQGRKHLLSGIIQCAHCDHIMYVAGSGGKYLTCPNHRVGKCRCRTQLPRQLAESQILDALGQRILQDDTWRNVVEEAASKSLRAECARVPAELRGLEAEAQNLETARGRLLRHIETSDKPDPDVSQRLREIRSQLSEVQSRRDELRSRVSHQPVRANSESIRSDLARLGQRLGSTTPAAAEALKRLLDGPIRVDEVAVEGKSRAFLRGTLKIRTSSIVGSLYPNWTCGAESPDSTERVETIILVFRKPTKTLSQGDAAWELYERGLLGKEIATLLGVSRARTTAILRAAALARGVSLVDGRKRRSQLGRKTIAAPLRVRLQPQVMQYWSEGLLIAQIADLVGADRATVTKIVAEWHDERGEKMPDGRTRRKNLAVKKRDRSHSIEGDAA